MLWTNVYYWKITPKAARMRLTLISTHTRSRNCVWGLLLSKAMKYTDNNQLRRFLESNMHSISQALPVWGGVAFSENYLYFTKSTTRKVSNEQSGWCNDQKSGMKNLNKSLIESSTYWEQSTLLSLGSWVWNAWYWNSDYFWPLSGISLHC